MLDGKLTVQQNMLKMRRCFNSVDMLTEPSITRAERKTSVASGLSDPAYDKGW
jgi:hypothetical protein